MGIPKIIFSPESHHPPHPCISGEIRHHPSAQLVVLFVVVSSFSRVVAISPSTPCLLLDKFTAPEFRKVARELSDPFFPSPFRSCARARARRLCSAAARHRAASYRAQNPILRRPAMSRRELHSGHESPRHCPRSLSHPARLLPGLVALDFGPRTAVFGEVRRLSTVRRRRRSTPPPACPNPL